MAEQILPYQRIFVTGGSGFVGRHLLEAMHPRLASGACVYANSHPDGTAVNLLDAAALRKVVATARPDLVFHLAAQSSVARSAGSAADTWDVNVVGTLNLAKAIAAEAPDALLAFTSSSEVYGATFNAGSAKEESPLAPLSIYGRTKRAAEDVLRDALAPTNRLIVFRPTSHSGPGQDTRFVLPAFADQVAAIEAGQRAPVIHVGSLSVERHFLDVRDVVEAYLDAVARRDLARSETFNVASNEPIPVGRLLEGLLSLSTARPTIEQDHARTRPHEIPRAAVDSGRITASIGWEPHRTLSETIASVLADRRSRYATLGS